MAPAFYFARVAYHGLRAFIIDARRYGELGFDERHLFWKKVQATVFIALMPAYIALGAAGRLARRC